MKPRRLHRLTIFSMLAAPWLCEGGRCVSGDLLIEAELTADYADVADNPARLNLETRKPRRKYKDNESGKQEKRAFGLLKHPQTSQIYADYCWRRNLSFFKSVKSA